MLFISISDAILYKDNLLYKSFKHNIELLISLINKKLFRQLVLFIMFDEDICFNSNEIF